MIVEVQQGKLEGTRAISELTGEEYVSFYGIPYAKPPIGDLRFRPPVPVDKWDGIFEATKEGSRCSQFEYTSRQFHGSEDCLYLNIATLSPPDEVKILKPVMVFIHGGGFFAGTGSFDAHGPDYLIGHDIVFVTLNYRLHALGFLNLGLEECPGNCGLKDQLLALKWIKKNISQFGGDPDNITIFGESAGASSVHLHMISPASKGLFNKAIMQSGSALSSWSLTTDPLERAQDLCKRLGFESVDPYEMLQFLKTQPVDNITKAAKVMNDEFKKEFIGKLENLSFAPSVETIAENAFLPDHPTNLLKTAEPIPVIAGYNSKEGRLGFIMWSKETLGILNENFKYLITQNFPRDPAQQERMSNEVKQFFFGDKKISLETIEEYTDLFTDLFFLKFYDSIEPIIQSKFPAYVYLFSFYGRHNFHTKMFMGALPLREEGAAHADELSYLFRRRTLPVQFEEPELSVIKNICTLWTNFAKTGNPTNGITEVQWRPFTEDEPCYLEIENDLKLVRGKIFGDRLEFWKKYLD